MKIVQIDNLPYFIDKFSGFSIFFDKKGDYAKEIQRKSFNTIMLF